MRKLITVLLVLSFSVLILPSKILAQEDTTTVEAGLTPDSPLYFLDKFFEEIELFFTFDETEKIEKKLNFVEERLAEMEEISDTATEEELEVLGEEYEEEMEEIEDDGEGQSEEVKAHVREMREKHIMVLERVMEKAPEQAKPALNNVIVRSKERLGIVDDVEDDDPEEEESEEIDDEVEIEEEDDKEKEDNPNRPDKEEKTNLGQRISEFVKSLGNRGRDVEEDDDLGDDMDDVEEEEIDGTEEE